MAGVWLIYVFRYIPYSLQVFFVVIIIKYDTYNMCSKQTECMLMSTISHNATHQTETEGAIYLLLDSLIGRPKLD